MTDTVSAASQAHAHPAGASPSPQPPAPRRRGMSRTRRRGLDAAWSILFVLGLLFVWQMIISLGLVDPLILPSPSATASATGDLAKDFFNGGEVLDSTWFTTKEVLLGFVLSTIVGAVLGVLAGDTRFGQKTLMPFLVAVNAAPRIAFAPVFVAWFGFGITAKVLLAAFIAFFPVVINTALGVRSCSVNSLLLFKSIRASRWQTMIGLKLPTALPSMFAGMKTAMTLCVVGAVVAEFVGGGESGLGELIKVATTQLDMDRVFALILLLSALGLVLYGLIELAERKVVYWRAGD